MEEKKEKLMIDIKKRFKLLCAYQSFLQVGHISIL